MRMKKVITIILSCAVSAITGYAQTSRNPVGMPNTVNIMKGAWQFQSNPAMYNTGDSLRVVYYKLLRGYQPLLQSGVTIKTINTVPVLGGGDITLKTINGINLIGAGDISVSGGGGGSISDGNKGDVTVSGAGTSWAVNALPISRITGLQTSLDGKMNEVRHDYTLLGDGVTGNELKVDTTKIATKNDLIGLDSAFIKSFVSTNATPVNVDTLYTAGNTTVVYEIDLVSTLTQNPNVVNVEYCKKRVTVTHSASTGYSVAVSSLATVDNVTGCNYTVTVVNNRPVLTATGNTNEIKWTFNIKPIMHHTHILP